MIYADPPRKYSKRGYTWSHLSSPDPVELTAYAKLHGLKRRDSSPWLHYDVTAEELETLPGIHRVSRREFMDIMRST